jgi:quinoprotein relay system zinc metallohydrolase 2
LTERRCAAALAPVAAAVLLALCAAVSAAEPALPAPLPPPLPVTEVAPGIFVHQGPHEEATAANLGGFANIGFVVGERAAAVIDPGGSYAQGRRLLAALRARTGLPVAAVIVTHVHPDHALGAAAFLEAGAEGARPAFVGHAKLPAALASRAAYYIERLRDPLGALADGTEAVPPDTLVQVEAPLELDLGGRVLTVRAHRTAHTDNDLTVFDSRTDTLWAADLLFMERIPVVDGSLKGWLAELAALREIPAARVVPGHGPAAADWPGALETERRYLERLLADTRAVIAEGGTIEAATKRVGRSEAGRWALFDAYHERNVLTAYTELEWE